MRLHHLYKAAVVFTAAFLFAFPSSLPVLAQLSFAPAVTYGSGGYGISSVAVADVNRDGKPDLVVANGGCNGSTGCGAGTVGVLLGNGDGTFQHVVTYGSGGTSFSVAVADVNGDGKPDIVVANVYENAVGVLLGNGDGTFQTAKTYGSGGSDPISVAVADVNADGKPDIIVANNISSSVGVLLGNGDGTFQPAVNYASGGLFAQSAAVADVNGDGKPDIIAVNCGVLSRPGICRPLPNPVGVLLGNRDGTFQPVVTYDAGVLEPQGVAVADVNGDGKPDIVVTSTCADNTCTSGSLGVLLGNGDGSFQPAVTYGSGGLEATSVAVADVNGDGKPDIVLSNAGSSGNFLTSGGIVSVLLGNGDGTFQTAVTYGSGANEAGSLVVADVNGDGKPDVVVPNFCGAGNCGFNGTVPVYGSVGVLINTSTPIYKAFVQPPINADGSSIFKANRGVIPVKFNLTMNNTPTCALPPATISVTRTAGGVIGSVDKSIYTMAADNGSNFRIDPTACQYIYNLGASSLGVGTYRVNISIDGVVVGDAVFALK